MPPFLKYNRIFCLIVILCFIISSDLISQSEDEWNLCIGETIRESKVISHQEEGYTIIYEIRSASCPRAKDGMFKLISILDKNFNRLESIKFEGQIYINNTAGSGFVVPLSGVGGQMVLIPDGTLFLKFSGGLWFQDSNLTIETGEASMPNLLNEPRAVINFEKSQHETCPEDMDGIISLYEKPKYNSPAKVIWSNGTEGFLRENLSAGLYSYTYEKVFVEKKCCLPDDHLVMTNKCLSELFDSQFDGAIPSDWYNPDGNYTQGEAFGKFYGDGCLFIPLDFSSENMAMAVKLSFFGALTIEIVDVDFNVLAAADFEGSDDITLPLDEINVTNPHVYIKITADEGTELYDIDVYTFDDYLDFSVSLKENDPKSDKRNIQEDVCVGNVLIPGTQISIEGGITPFSFDWALDGDMVFDDVDSLYHEIEITSEGLTEIALKVEDFAGHIDTVFFEYNAYQLDIIKMGIPSLSIEENEVNIITICADEDPFELSVNMPNISLSSDGEGLSGMIFDPSLAGLGNHFIIASGDVCDVQAGLSINVIEEPNVTLNDLPSLYTCSDPLDLSTLITEGTGGIWILNDTSYIFNDTLYNDQTSVGPNNLSYEIGGGLCLTSVSIPYDVLPSPEVDLIEPTETIDPDDTILDLSQFLGTSTSGGVWSGENILDGFFDPSGLANGFYDVTYTVGEDGCEVYEIISIEVKMVTATFDENLERLKIFPVPSRDYIQVCSEVALPKTYKIYNSFGKLISITESADNCKQFGLAGFLPGCYFLHIQTANSQINKIFVVVN